MKSGRKIHDSLAGPDAIRTLKNGELRTLIRFLQRQAETSVNYDGMLCEALCQAAIRFMKDNTLKKVRRVLG